MSYLPTLWLNCLPFDIARRSGSAGGSIVSRLGQRAKGRRVLQLGLPGPLHWHRAARTHVIAKKYEICILVRGTKWLLYFGPVPGRWNALNFVKTFSSACVPLLRCTNPSYLTLIHTLFFMAFCVLCLAEQVSNGCVLIVPFRCNGSATAAGWARSDCLIPADSGGYAAHSELRWHAGWTDTDWKPSLI